MAILTFHLQPRDIGITPTRTHFAHVCYRVCSATHRLFLHTDSSHSHPKTFPCISAKLLWSLQCQNKQKCHVLDCNRFVKYLRKGMKRKTSGNKEVGGRAGASNHRWSQPWACAEGKTRLLSADSPLPRMVSPSMARVIHGQLQCETLNQKKCQN